MRANGPSSEVDPGCELYELERMRLKDGFPAWSVIYVSWL